MAPPPSFVDLVALMEVCVAPVVGFDVAEVNRPVDRKAAVDTEEPLLVPLLVRVAVARKVEVEEAVAPRAKLGQLLWQWWSMLLTAAICSHERNNLCLSNCTTSLRGTITDTTAKVWVTAKTSRIRG
jgi:hypothetical protein